MVKRALPASVLSLSLGLTGLFGLLLQALTTVSGVPATVAPVLPVTSPALRVLAVVMHTPCVVLIASYVVLGLRSGGLMAVRRRKFPNFGKIPIWQVGQSSRLSASLDGGPPLPHPAAAAVGGNNGANEPGWGLR
jgi:hypothetical protein